MSAALNRLVAGTTVYLPVLVEGALLSLGDGHAAQGDGEVSGTAIEAPLRIVYEVTRRATLAMIDYLARQHGLDRTDACALASVAAHLKIAETVDVPHMLVTMRIPRDILPGPAELEAAGGRQSGVSGERRPPVARTTPARCSTCRAQPVAAS